MTCNVSRVKKPQWQQSAVSSLPALRDSKDMPTEDTFEKPSSKVQKIFFSLVEVPTVSLKLELAPNPEQFSMREYMLTTDQSPTILFADPRLDSDIKVLKDISEIQFLNRRDIFVEQHKGDVSFSICDVDAHYNTVL